MIKTGRHFSYSKILLRTYYLCSYRFEGKKKNQDKDSVLTFIHLEASLTLEFMVPSSKKWSEGQSS